MRILALLLFVCLWSCKSESDFDQQGYNVIGKKVQAEMNKLSIPCPVGDRVQIFNIDSITIDELPENEGYLDINQKYTLQYEETPVSIYPNKRTKDGFQFRYVAYLKDYALDKEQPVITKDEGTVWLYCDDYKKHNTPKARKKQQQTTGKMIIVE